MFDKDNKFGFINNNESNNNNSNNIKNTDLPYTVSSKVLATVSASDIKLNNEITINNVSFNKDRKYYIEFLGSKKLCSLSISEVTEFICTIDDYVIQGITYSSNLILGVHKMNANDTTDTFTDLVIYEEEIKCLDNKYLKNDLRVQNSISLGRVGDIGTGSSAVGNSVEASGMFSHAECYLTEASGNFSHAEGSSTTSSGESSHAEGYWTKASSDCQHVQGKCNIEDTEGKYAHIVGNGKDGSNRANAHTLDWKGNAWFAGQVEATNLPYTIFSKKLATVPASNVKLGNPITVNNTNINKDKRYYIEFLSTKKLCSLLTSEEDGNCIICSIGNYIIRVFNDSNNILININKINTADTTTTDTFTDLIIHEEEIKCLDSKYLETDLVLQNSISLGRVGNIGMGSSAIGIGAEASGDCSHAEGSTTTASGFGSHAEGESTIASGNQSHTEGDSTTASGNCSHAEGGGTTASGNCSHAEGESTIASGDCQHVQGKYNIEDTEGKYAHIVGNGTDEDARSNAHTLDWQGNGWYAGEVQATNLSYTISSKVLATVSASNVKIDDNITVNNVSINKDKRYYIGFLGSKKLCSLSVDEEMGNCIICNIDNYEIDVFNDSTDIIVSITKINKDDTTNTFTDLVIYEEEVKYLDSKYLETDLVLQNSISLGRVGDIGKGSSAIGNGVKASGYFSHAEGYYTKAIGNHSHAEGSGTTASGVVSHAEGNYTTASGNYSHTEGYYTKASGYASHTEGEYTKASSQYQHVQGKYNIEDTANKYAHIVGNGKKDLISGKEVRSNAHTLDWKGNGWYAGKLSQESAPTEDKDLTTKKYVDDKVSSLPQFSFNESGELVVTINGVSKIFVPKSE